jgi:two-component system sensor histidine kinase SenX3
VGNLVNRRPTIGDVEWASAVGWHRRPGRVPGPQAQRLAADALTSLRVGVLVLDAMDNPVLANPAAVELGLVRDAGQPGVPGGNSGRDGAGSPGNSGREGTASHEVHAVIRTLAGQVRRSGGRREVELDLPRGTSHGLADEPLGVRVRVIPLTGTEYPVGHVAIEASDVTEAHRVARVRRDFVANVSHELKTPVGALALLAETLLEAMDDPEASRRFAERIHHESQRLWRLVKELLELSRLQGAEPLPAPLPVAVDRIVNEVVDRTRTAAAAKTIDVRATGERGLTVFGNEGQLVTAVANLVENAIAYSPEETTVTIDTCRNREVVEIAVIDQGIGIAAKDLDRIFERFYRADLARSRDTGGTGLGLAIVRHIAVNHAGRVDVRSTQGAGSTFTLRMPIRPPEAALPLPPGVEIDSAGSDVL